MLAGLHCLCLTELIDSNDDTDFDKELEGDTKTGRFVRGLREYNLTFDCTSSDAHFRSARNAIRHWQPHWLRGGPGQGAAAGQRPVATAGSLFWHCGCEEVRQVARLGGGCSYGIRAEADSEENLSLARGVTHSQGPEQVGSGGGNGRRLGMRRFLRESLRSTADAHLVLRLVFILSATLPFVFIPLPFSVRVVFAPKRVRPESACVPYHAVTSVSLRSRGSSLFAGHMATFSIAGQNSILYSLHLLAKLPSL